MLLVEDSERGEARHQAIAELITQGARLIPAFIKQTANTEPRRSLEIRMNEECERLRQANSAQDLEPLADAVQKPFSERVYYLIDNAMYEAGLHRKLPKKIFIELAIYLYVRDRMQPEAIQNLTERVRQQMMLKAAKESGQRAYYFIVMA
jgi:hypothetical protein